MALLFFFLLWLLSFPTPGCRSHHLRAPSEHLTQWHLCKINKNGTNIQFSVRAAGAIRGADSESAILLGNAPKENLWSVFAPCLQKGGRWARETVDRLLCCLSKFSWLTYTVLKWKIGSEKHLFFLLKRQCAITDVKAAPSFLFFLLWCYYICVMLVETEPAAVSFPGWVKW